MLIFWGWDCLFVIYWFGFVCVVDLVLARYVFFFVWVSVVSDVLGGMCVLLLVGFVDFSFYI